MSLTKVESKIGKSIYAAIVILFAVGFPAFLLRNTSISEIKLSFVTVFITLLYFGAVVGFVALIFNIKSVNIKVMDLDNKTKGKLKKLYLVAMIIVSINIVFMLFRLLFEFWK